MLWSAVFENRKLFGQDDQNKMTLERSPIRPETMALSQLFSQSCKISDKVMCEIREIKVV
jgi:hypothetical protein